MKKFVVSYYSLFTGELESRLVCADSWQETLTVSGFFSTEEIEDIITDCGNDFTLEDVKEYCLNCDSNVDVIEVFS